MISMNYFALQWYNLAAYFLSHDSLGHRGGSQRPLLLDGAGSDLGSRLPALESSCAFSSLCSESPVRCCVVRDLMTGDQGLCKHSHNGAGGGSLSRKGEPIPRRGICPYEDSPVALSGWKGPNVVSRPPTEELVVLGTPVVLGLRSGII